MNEHRIADDSCVLIVVLKLVRAPYTFNPVKVYQGNVWSWECMYINILTNGLRCNSCIFFFRSKSTSIIVVELLIRFFICRESLNSTRRRKRRKKSFSGRQWQPIFTNYLITVPFFRVVGNELMRAFWRAKTINSPTHIVCSLTWN